MTCALRENILNFDRPVPRYTSYPTAPHFMPMDDASAYDEWLRGVPEDADLSLYLHVPFCPKLCWYCGCHTKITQRYAPVEDYAHLMLREIDLLRDVFGGRRKVGHIHFGGGSPGMLRSCDFSMIMERLQRSFDLQSDVEIAIEVDPRGLSEGRVAAYAKHGVNRISLGVQDFNDDVLRAVNREQPFYLTYDAVSLFRGYGIERINMDLLYGLPLQTPEKMQKTVEQAVLLRPDRVSLFGYAHVPWMKKHMRLINEGDLPGKALRFDLFEVGTHVLMDAGYEAIGIDHFARPEDALCDAARDRTMRRNFQGYTTDSCGAMIGIGASSIGRLPQGYVQNAVEMPHYETAVLGGRLPAQKMCPMSAEDVLRGAVIEHLMCFLQVDVGAVCRDFGVEEHYFDDIFRDLAIYEAQGFLTVSDRHISVHPQARPMTRLVAAAFDSYYSGQVTDAPRHAKAV